MKLYYHSALLGAALAAFVVASGPGSAMAGSLKVTSRSSGAQTQFPRTRVNRFRASGNRARSGSVSILHVPSGLYVQGAYSDEKSE